MIYIKPWDDEVFKNFLDLVLFVKCWEEENAKKMDLCIPRDLQEMINEKKDICEAKGFSREFSIFENKTIKDRCEVKYIVTLGGDGTVLWASKQFSGNYFPPLIAFSLGSLGFLANFEFKEHPKVLAAILLTFFDDEVTIDKNNYNLGIDKRMRLKVNMGTGCETERKVFKGN